MPSATAKANWKTFFNISAPIIITGYQLYRKTDDIALLFFLSLYTILLELITFLYDHHISTRRSGDNKYPDIDIPLINEKEKKRDFNDLITNENGKWVRISIVVMLAILSKIATSKWILPGLICLDYLLFETRQFLNRTYNKIFQSINDSFCWFSKEPITNSMGWPKWVTIIVALLFNGIQFFILALMLEVSCGLIPLSIVYEFYKYLKVVLNSGNDELPYNMVFEHFVFIFENYTVYVVVFIILTGWYVIRRYWKICAYI